jgi:transcriptional regulator with PAS, ATPase and Fis domain
MKAQSKYYKKFRWSGNIRQLRNVAEQISVLETNRDITAILQSYLPSEGRTFTFDKIKKAMAILVTKGRFCIKYF